MKCRGCAVLSAWRPFDGEAFYFNFFSEISECRVHTQSNTHGRGAERFGLRDPKMKWVIKVLL